jgi:hypothetical protein
MLKAALRRYVNCGTVLAAVGFLFFAFFGWLLIQFLCSGEGAPGSGWLHYPG